MPPFTRHLRTVVLAASCAAVLSACGGGGGGDDEDDDFFQILAFYDFAVTNPTGAPAPLTKTVINTGIPDDVYSIDAGTGTIRGRYFTSDSDLTIADNTTYGVNWSQGGPTPAQFTVGFTSAASFPSGTFLPSSGSFAVTWGTDTITVDYGMDVSIALNGGPPAVFEPTEFVLLDVPGSAAPDWQRVAARASSALTDTLAQVRGVPLFLQRVYDGELDSGQAVTDCPAIPGSPPPGIGQVGEVVAVELGGGTQYLSTFTECFAPAPSPTTGLLVAGTIDRRNLVTTVEDGNLVGFGFVGSSQVTGGVTLDVQLRLLLQNAGAWSFAGGETLYDGGFSVRFNYPD